jgi:acetyltransferase-like isoleucine patch superfamily enzyme
MEPAHSTVLKPGEISRARDFASALSPQKRLMMLLINYWPLLHLISIVIVATLPWAFWRWRILAGLALLYLFPPMVARLLRFASPIQEGRIFVGSRTYFIWWMMFNLQVVFSRLPMLEEILRLVPGLYSFWLRLWGAQIGKLTYWSAGLRILDRSFLRIGDDVVFGAAVRLNPHVLAKSNQGQLELILATVIVGDRAIVGGYSLLTAGTEIAMDECTKAFLISPPFGRWKGGVRLQKTDPVL